MKISKKCPKCKSDFIIALKEGIFDQREFRNVIHLSTFSTVQKVTYICCECGYTEEWLKDSDLDLVKSYKDSDRNILK